LTCKEAAGKNTTSKERQGTGGAQKKKENLLGVSHKNRYSLAALSAPLATRKKRMTPMVVAAEIQ
jgi:hypothetical protein